MFFRPAVISILFFALSCTAFAQKAPAEKPSKLSPDKIFDLKTDLDILLDSLKDEDIEDFNSSAGRFYNWGEDAIPDLLKIYAAEKKDARRIGLFCLLAFYPAMPENRELTAGLQKNLPDILKLLDKTGIPPAVRAELAFALIYNEKELLSEFNAEDTITAVNKFIKEIIPQIKKKTLNRATIDSLELIATDTKNVISPALRAEIRKGIREAKGEPVIGEKTEKDLENPLAAIKKALDENNRSAFDSQVAAVRNFIGEKGIAPLIALYEPADKEQRAIIFSLLSSPPLSYTKEAQDFISAHAEEIIDNLDSLPTYSYKIRVLEAFAAGQAVLVNKEDFLLAMQANLPRIINLLRQDDMNDSDYALSGICLSFYYMHTDGSFGLMKAVAQKVMNDEKISNAHRHTASKLATLNFITDIYSKPIKFSAALEEDAPVSAASFEPESLLPAEIKLGSATRYIRTKDNRHVGISWSFRSGKKKAELIPPEPNEVEKKEGRLKCKIACSFGGFLSIVWPLDTKGYPKKTPSISFDTEN